MWLVSLLTSREGATAISRFYPHQWLPKWSPEPPWRCRNRFCVFISGVFPEGGFAIWILAGFKKGRSYGGCFQQEFEKGDGWLMVTGYASLKMWNVWMLDIIHMLGGKRWHGNTYPISVEWVSMLLGYLTPQVQANDMKARDNSISINDVGRKGIVPSSALFLLH